MNKCFLKFALCIGAVAIISGCASSRDTVGVTNQEQPGPAIGRAVGSGVGAVGGNVVGAGVGVVEGASGSVKSVFDNTQRTVRYWHEEKTADGRTNMVSELYLVDTNGRIIRKLR